MKTNVNTFVKALAAAKEQSLPMGHIVVSCDISLPSREEFEILLDTENVRRLWHIYNGLFAIEECNCHSDEASQMRAKVIERIQHVLEERLNRSQGNVDLQLEIESLSPTLSKVKESAQRSVIETIRDKARTAKLKKLQLMLKKIPNYDRRTDQLKHEVGGRIWNRYEYKIRSTNNPEVLWQIAQAEDAGGSNQKAAFDKLVRQANDKDALLTLYRLASDGKCWNYKFTGLWFKLVDFVDGEKELLWMIEEMSGKADSSQRHLIRKIFLKIIEVSKWNKSWLLQVFVRHLKNAVQNARKQWDWFPFVELNDWEKFLKFFNEGIADVGNQYDAKRLYNFAVDLQYWSGYMIEVRNNAMGELIARLYPEERKAV